VYKEECTKDPACAKGWSWPLCLEEAVMDPVEAYKCMQALPRDAFDTQNAAANGNSLTNSLHWIATRPGASAAAGQMPPYSRATVVPTMAPTVPATSAPPTTTDAPVILKTAAPTIPAIPMPAIRETTSTTRAATFSWQWWTAHSTPTPAPTPAPMTLRGDSTFRLAVLAGIDDSACSAHPRCHGFVAEAAKGGQCCPTAEGIPLDCCDMPDDMPVDISRPRHEKVTFLGRFNVHDGMRQTDVYDKQPTRTQAAVLLAAATAALVAALAVQRKRSRTRLGNDGNAPGLYESLQTAGQTSAVFSPTMQTSE